MSLRFSFSSQELFQRYVIDGHENRVVVFDRVKKLMLTRTSFHFYEIFKETAMTKGNQDEVSSFGSTQIEHVLPPNVTPENRNTSRTAREELLPQSASRGK